MFSLNSVTKNSTTLLCKRPACYHSASKTSVRDRIFNSSPIHASVIIKFPEFNEISAPFRKNSTVAVRLSEGQIPSTKIERWPRPTPARGLSLCADRETVLKT